MVGERVYGVGMKIKSILWIVDSYCAAREIDCGRVYSFVLAVISSIL